jgi:hypothetical protein
MLETSKMGIGHFEYKSLPCLNMGNVRVWDIEKKHQIVYLELKEGSGPFSKRNDLESTSSVKNSDLCPNQA